MNADNLRNLIKSLAAINSDLKKMIATANSNLDLVSKRTGTPVETKRKVIVDQHLNRVALVQHILSSQN